MNSILFINKSYQGFTCIISCETYNESVCFVFDMVPITSATKYNFDRTDKDI